MSREFIMSAVFDRNWKSMGLGDEELSVLQNYLSKNPTVGDVIPELEGARKVRFAIDGKGKSGGARVIYLDVVVKEELYLIYTYPKSMQSDIIPKEKKKILEMVRESKKTKKKE